MILQRVCHAFQNFGFLNLAPSNGLGELGELVLERCFTHFYARIAKISSVTGFILPENMKG